MQGHAGGSCWQQAIFVMAMLAAATSGAAAAVCEDGRLSVHAGVPTTQSEWFEFDTGGRELVHEAGMLQGTELGLGLLCRTGALEVSLSQVDGVRRYDGETQAGVPVISHSAIRQFYGYLQASVPLDEAWTLGARVSTQKLWRDIGSLPNATGYPERFDWTVLSLGVQWRSALGPGQMTLGLWSGQAVHSGMVLHYPGYDPAKLPLGAISQMELAAGWRMRWRGAWSLQAGAMYRQTDIGRGALTVLTRSGMGAGVAQQPRSRLVDMPVHIQMAYEF